MLKYLLFILVIYNDVKAFLPQQTNQLAANLCDCVRLPGSQQCLKYDNRLQAKNLDEALSHFEDLSLLGEIKAPQKLNRDPTSECQTEDCRICRQILAKKLKAVGLLQSFVQEVTGQNLTTQNLTNSCEKYRFARRNSDTFDLGDQVEDDEDDSSSSSSEEKDKKKKHKKNEKQSKNTGEQTTTESSISSFLDKFFGRRKKRAILAPAPTDPDFIGTRYYLSCTDKGSNLDGSGLLSLCTKCWAWRELPENYYPRYVNELVCHPNSTDCLSGYATCGSGTQQLDVLRNDSGTLVPITLAASTYCECQIKAGSTLEPLIFGNPYSSPLPGIPPAIEPTPAPA